MRERRPFRLALRRAMVAGLAGGFVVACGVPPASMPMGRELVVSVSASPPVVEAQAVSRRWQVADIYQYEVSLRRWDGARFADLDPPLKLVLPQKGERRHEARFFNLRQGERYQVDVLAKGNVGGSAPDVLLNAEIPAQVAIDLSGTQDVESVRRESVIVSLDSVPFAGSLTLALRNVPGFVRRFTVDLQDARSGETRYSGSFASGQTMTLSNLKVGVDYQVRLSAYRANGRLYQTIESAIVRFDPEEDALEQERTLEIAF